MKMDIENNFNSLEYKRSRGAYMAQCTIEYLVSLLVTDVFLAKLLTSIGISDAISGIISSFIALAFVIQLFSIALMKTKYSIKKMVICFDTLSIFFFMFIFFVPLMPVSQVVKQSLVIVGILFAYAGKYLILSMCFKWANEYVDPFKRAVYSAKKEMLSLFIGMIFTVVVGYIVDEYENVSNLNGAFLFIAISIFILNICNFICLALIKKEAPKSQKDSEILVKDVLKNTIFNKNFKNIIILTVLWDVARYFTLGFMGVFKTNSLMMSIVLVQTINVVANLMRLIVSIPFGKYSDRKSFAKGYKLALCVAAIAFFANIFTTNDRWWLVIVFTVLFNCSYAGINQNSFNITYSYVDLKYIPQAMAVKNCIGGICGFIASIVGGKVLDIIQTNGNVFFGINVYGQQIMSAISFIITVSAVLFVQLVIEKQKIKKQ